MSLPIITAQADRFLELEQQILGAQPAIEHWLRSQWVEHAAPFYASVDLRNGGFKLAPVDTNLFPGGFNNLNPEFLPLCVQAAMIALETVCPDARGALLIPENHTRNTFYLENVAVLKNILRRADEGAHRHADPGDHRTHRDPAARRRHAAARAAGEKGQPSRRRRFR
jgi:glutamate--cysteine ligase